MRYGIIDSDADNEYVKRRGFESNDAINECSNIGKQIVVHSIFAILIILILLTKLIIVCKNYFEFCTIRS